MYNNDMPSRDELPGTAQLIRSTLIALVVALVLLVTVVMPAEYAVDPTGAGRLLGLMEMGEIKQQLAEEAAAEEAATVSVQAPEPVAAAGPEPEYAPLQLAQEPARAPVAEPGWQDEVTFVLTPGEGTEYKLTMNEGAVARYSWLSEGGPVNYDTHGDGGGDFISYEKARGVRADEGELEAAFTGNHGWFFRNRNDHDVTLVLRTSGDYGEMKKML
ncbi:hypothetical protein [Marinobacter sp.]|uniref:hypothetical protein n=1 Tax=Marinobacter sp. TaxID=50741 RepID=UPI002B48EF61|nr:hypothetical protein [Marinobacter sp.]HKK57042.1 hypothetical protein [Marinobacter sp.]